MSNAEDLRAFMKPLSDSLALSARLVRPGLLAALACLSCVAWAEQDDDKADRAHRFALGQYTERVAPALYMAVTLEYCAAQRGGDLTTGEANDHREMIDFFRHAALLAASEVAADAPESIRSEVISWGYGYLAGQTVVRPELSIAECEELYEETREARDGR